MTIKKESIEVHCAGCKTGFRLWIPAETVLDWEKGTRINCVKCGAPYFVMKGNRGFDVSPVDDRPNAGGSAEKPAPGANASIKGMPAMSSEADDSGREAAILEDAVVLEDGRQIDDILYIEDDRLSRKMVEAALKDTDVKLLTVKNASEALGALKKRKISLIVTDLYLKNPNDPESSMDGEELLRRVVDMGFSIPSIIITGKAIIDDIELEPKWFDLRVKGFIQKGNPFWVDDLKLKIKETLYKD